MVSAFACALHMHQPTIPAGKDNNELISNLQNMFDNPGQGDNHNAQVFAWCYERMGTFISELVEEGCNPRIMLDYSGNLLWGLQQMGREDIIAKLRLITTDPRYYPCVEWLGTTWSHAVIPSTPIPDIKLHLLAWQHHFASLFGIEALRRVKGFSPPEMHLPNHPDTLYHYIKNLKECGYLWLLVQEHTVSSLEGKPLMHSNKYVPNRLVAKDSTGHEISIIAIIKTQGSDTKLVGQMQPYHEAKSMKSVQLAGKTIPPLITQIADGENGGVMMNEFPRDFSPLWRNLRDSGAPGTKEGQCGTAGINISEYMDLLYEAGITEMDFPVCQAVGQSRIWE
eukprot:Ihof_evm3s65 gene=Ihof_evmTU3s65